MKTNLFDHLIVTAFIPVDNEISFSPVHMAVFVLVSVCMCVHVNVFVCARIYVEPHVLSCGFLFHSHPSIISFFPFASTPPTL